MDTASGDEAALLERCARVGTATWSDAMDTLGIAGVMSGLPMRSGAGRCAGFAVTLSARQRDLGGYAASEFGQDRMVTAAGPGQVLVVGASGIEVSCMGGIVALAAFKRGIAGVVIDGACRDIEDIRRAGLWVASRHVTPRSGKRRLHLHAIGEPAQAGGLTVHAGDLVAGDSTGVVVVPRARLHEVLAEAERVLGSDARLERSVAQGQSLEQAAAQLQTTPR